jgi:hypothetical protein
MSFTARLHIKGFTSEDQGLKILSYNLGFSQEVDIKGEIASGVRSGFIEVTIQATRDAELVQWMVADDKRNNGRISLSGVFFTGPRKSIVFEDAVLVNYQESFSDKTDTVISLSISARKITIEGVSFEMVWVNGPPAHPSEPSK